MYLQRLGKALMLPVSVMPICALMMGIGYCMCPAAMQGGEITGVVGCIGYFLIRAGSALIDHIAWLFAIGVGIGMSEDNNGTGALAALVSWLMIITLLNVDTISILMPSLAENSSQLMAFSKIDNPFIGILSGIIGSTCYNRFHKTKLPNWLSFFSGKRTVAIVAGICSVGVSFVLLLVWPLVFSGLTALGRGIEGLGPAGAGIYAFLNRLLIPFGLHHALNNVFWFDTIGLGDLTHFWAGETSNDVSWSLGMYMSGFFPCMMFGVPAASLAVIKCAKPERRKEVMGIMLSSALCSFVCGVTEPFEFAFMFLAPELYLVYALLYGVITYITVITGFRAGFSFSGGITDLIFSSSLPAASKTWMIIPLGALAFALFYIVFRFMIVKCNLKTPGREDVENEIIPAKGKSDSVKDKYVLIASSILKGLGGAQNLISIDNCITRLRLEIKNMDLVDDAVIRSSGALAVVRPGKNFLQIVIGTHVQFVADELKVLFKEQTEEKDNQEAANQKAADYVADIEEKQVSRKAKVLSGEIHSPAEGEVISMEEIPDPVFSRGIMGECIGILSTDGKIYAPISGTVTTVVATKHAISFEGDAGEILVHVGLDTVKMNGDGFKLFVQEGDIVEQGQLVMEADIELIQSRGFNPMVIVVRI